MIYIGASDGPELVSTTDVENNLILPNMPFASFG
jgi:hypothetical protein